MKIKAISLWEPWASLMRVGAKTIETRSWATIYRGPLLICAAKRWTFEQESFLARPSIQSVFQGYIPSQWICKDRMLLGMAVCLVDLVDCQQSGGTWMWPAREIWFGDLTKGRYAWITENCRTFDPFPVRGAQGLFEVELPAHVAELIK